MVKVDESLPARIAGLLSAHGVPGSALELEITESVIMIDPRHAREVLDALGLKGRPVPGDAFVASTAVRAAESESRPRRLVAPLR